jgi:hypothetical protein
MGGRTLVFGSRGEMGLADVDRHVVPKDSGPPCTISKLTMTANEVLCRYGYTEVGRLGAFVCWFVKD